MLYSHTVVTGSHFFFFTSPWAGPHHLSVVPDEPNTPLYLSSVFTGIADVICHAAAAAGRLTVLTRRRAFLAASVPPTQDKQSRQSEWAASQAASPTGRHTWEPAKQEGNKWWNTPTKQHTHLQVSLLISWRKSGIGFYWLPYQWGKPWVWNQVLQGCQRHTLILFSHIMAILW